MKSNRDVVRISSSRNQLAEPAHHYCAKTAAPPIGKADSPGSGFQLIKHASFQHEGGEYGRKHRTILGGHLDPSQGQYQPNQPGGPPSGASFQKCGKQPQWVVLLAIQHIHGRARIHDIDVWPQDCCVLGCNRQQGEVVKISPHDYYKLTGNSQFISADERMQVLCQTYMPQLLCNVGHLVHWTTNVCLYTWSNDIAT